MFIFSFRVLYVFKRRKCYGGENEVTHNCVIQSRIASTYLKLLIFSF